MNNLEELIHVVVHEPVLSGKTYIHLISGTSNSFTSGHFAVSGNEVLYDGEITVALFDKYNDEIIDFMLGKGILCIKVEAGKLVEHCIVKDMNPELFAPDAFELLIYQRYGLEPQDEERKAVLQKSLKAEKIKDTLVFACFMDDMEKIKERIPGARKSDLDMALRYTGTPLQFCSKHNNLEAFRLLAEKGASVGKSALSQTPLEIAFQHSSDIVRYIHSQFPDVYEKEVKKKGFRIALHCRDELLLEDILALGCEVNKEKAPFPPLHNFADFNNAVGIKFLLDHGADIECQNKHKQTALHRAVSRGQAAAVEQLLEYGANIHAVDQDGKSAADLAAACSNEEIVQMMAGC